VIADVGDQERRRLAHSSPRGTLELGAEDNDGLSYHIKVAVMAYRVLHGLAPPYLSQLARVADLPSRRRLRSSSTTHQLHVPPFRLSTVGRRSFPVAAAILWNTLPVDVQSSPSLPVFRQRLKTFLFHKSFPDVV